MTPEQAVLLDKARRSKQMAELATEQGHHDFAVSHAYYAMFYIAKALLLGEGIESLKHTGIMGEFGRVFASVGRVPVEFHRYLIDAQDERLFATYGMSGQPITEGDAATQIERAEQFIALGERLLGAGPSTDEE